MSTGLNHYFKRALTHRFQLLMDSPSSDGNDETIIDYDVSKSNDLMDQLSSALEKGNLTTLEWDLLLSSTEVDATIVEIGKRVVGFDYISSQQDGDANSSNLISLSNGTKIKPYNYLMLLSEIMTRVLQDPEAKANDFERWMDMMSFDRKTSVSIIDLIFNTFPKCTKEFLKPVMLPSSSKSTVQSNVSLHDHIVPIILAFIFRLPPRNFKIVERTLFRNILSKNLINVTISSSIFCLISRSNDDIRISFVDTLMKVRRNVSKERENNINNLIIRLLKFHAEVDWDLFLKSYNVLEHSFLIPGLKNVASNTLDMIIINCTTKYMSSEEVSVEKLCNLVELLSFQENPNETLIKRILSILIQTESSNDEFNEDNSRKIRKCLLKLHKYLKINFINDIITNYENNSNDFESANFIMNLLNMTAERIAGNTKYQKSILEKSFKIVANFPENGLLLSTWFEFCHKFCSHVGDKNVIVGYFNVTNSASKTPIKLRSLFQKYLLKSDPKDDQLSNIPDISVGSHCKSCPLLVKPSPVMPTNVKTEQMDGHDDDIGQKIKDFEVETLDLIIERNLASKYEKELSQLGNKIESILKVKGKRLEYSSDDDIQIIP